MKKILFTIICLCLGAIVSLAEVPQLVIPDAIELKGNGLNSLAFVVQESGVSPESITTLRYFWEGFPAANPPSFDDVSKLFFWRPEAHQVGNYNFTLTVKDPVGEKSTAIVKVNVLAAPSLEALPKRWQDTKKEIQYLEGRDYLPATNLVEVSIAARPQYEIEIKVKDSFDQDCTLTYLPHDGKAVVNKTQKTAKIMMGGRYASTNLKLIRLNLYEDLFNQLGLVYKKIESIKISGGYLLKSFQVMDKIKLVAATGLDNIRLPTLNLSFDGRFYEESLYNKDEPMMISDTPTIKIDFNTTSGLIWRRTRLVIDETEYSAARGDFSTVTVKPYKDVSSFDVNYAMYMLKIPHVKRLAFGEHQILFEMENAFGLVVTTEGMARVVSLPSEIIGKPIVYPNPFNPRQHNKVEIQYKLSMQANIEIVIFGSDGSAKVKKRFSMGEEGARKGLNKVVWDGKSELGAALPNGIYSGVIIDKGENRVLDKFRFTVFR